MALINLGKSIIQENNLSSFYQLDCIRMIYKKSHIQPEILPSCDEMGNIGVFSENRTISEKICHFTLILQGGIAFFAVFSLGLRFSPKIARNEKESVVLLDLKKNSGFPDKSLIFLNHLMCFYGMVRNHVFLGKLHNLNSDLMSSNYVGLKYYELKKNEGSDMLNKYTISPIGINLWK